MQQKLRSVSEVTKSMKVGLRPPIGLIRKCFQQQLTAVLGTNTALSLQLVCVKIADPINLEVCTLLTIYSN